MPELKANFTSSPNVKSIVIITRKCLGCEQSTEVTVDQVAYDNYAIKRMFVQDAFPNLTPAQRELFITGTHGDCWNAIFADEE